MSFLTQWARALRARMAVMLVLAMGAMSLTAVGAQATQVEWWSGVLPSHKGALSSSLGRYTSHMLSHTVYYTGSGTVSVCEGVFDLTSFTWISKKCGNQFAEATPSEVEPHLGNLMEGEAYNNSGFAHTIHAVWVE